MTDVSTAALLAGAVGCAVHLNSIGGDIVWDDRVAISGNADVRGDRPIDDVLSHDFWGQPMDAPDSHKSYRPLTVLTYRLNWALHGAAPWGFHAANVALHALVCCLVVRRAAALFHRERDGGADAALCAGLLFATHPVHTEAVCALVGRADILAGAFSLAALDHYGRAAQRRGTDVPALAAALLCVVCAALCKETGLTLLGAFVAHELLLVVRVAPLLRLAAAAAGGASLGLPAWPAPARQPAPAAAAAAAAAVAVTKKRGAGATAASGDAADAAPHGTNTGRGALSPDAAAADAAAADAAEEEDDDDALLLRPFPTTLRGAAPRASSWPAPARRVGLLVLFGGGFLAARLSLHRGAPLYRWTLLENHVALLPSAAHRAMSYAYVHARYLWLLAWPSGLCFDHGFDAVPALTALWDNRLLEACLAYGAVAALAWLALMRAEAPLLFCGAFAAASFLPAAHLLLPVGTIVGERLLYVPSIGYCLGLGLLLARGCRLLQRALLRYGGAVSVPARWAHRLMWAPLLLFVLPWAAHSVSRNADWRSELALFEAGYATNPRSLKVLNNLGQALLQTDAARAAAVLEEAVAIHPTYTVGLLNLGLAYHSMDEPGAAQQALDALRRCLVLDPQQNKARAYLGAQLMQMWLASGGEEGRGDPKLLDGAIATLTAATARGSRIPVAYHALASAHYYSKDLPNAMRYYELALQMNAHARVHEPPAAIDDGKTRNMLALTLAEMGRPSDALAQYEAGIKANPAAHELYSNAAGLLVEQGDVAQAMKLYTHAMSLVPDSPELANNVGWVLEKNGQLVEAMGYYKQALALVPEHAQIQTNVRNLQDKIAAST